MKAATSIRVWRLLSAVCVFLLAGSVFPLAVQATELANLPEGWRAHFVSEPVLNSQMRVMRLGDRGKPPLVLLHGLGQNGLMDWRAIIEALGNDYYIVAPDFPGFGASGGSTKRLSPENFADLVYWLVRDEGLEDVHLAGHSMGGAVALFYAAKYPDTLARLTLIDAAGILHRTAFVKSLADLDRRYYNFLPEGLQRPAARLLNFGNRLVEQINFLPDLSQPLSRSDLAWSYLLDDQPNTDAALSMINTDFSQVVDAIETPTRIVWGERDPVAPLRSALLLRGMIPEVELNVIAEAEHLPIKSHARQVADWMRRPLNPSARQQGSRQASVDEAPVLTCRGRTGLDYSGVYSRIVLDDCLDLRLVDVTTASIEMTDSEAELVRVTVTGQGLMGEGVGLKALRSIVRLTDAEITAETAVSLDTSRLDMAGVLLKASGTIRVLGPSVIIASVSECQSPLYRGKLHGAVRAENLRGEALSQLRSQAPTMAR